VAIAPFSAFEWMVAGRYLRSRRREGFVSVITAISFIGIALGVATLIIVMSVMNGFRIDLMSRILGVNGHMVVQGLGGPLENFDAIAARVRAVDGVVRAVPIIEGQVMATGREAAGSGVLVRGIRQEDLSGQGMIAGHILSGTLDRFSQDEGLVIGVRLAQKLGARVGDMVTLLSPRGAATPFGTAPRVLAYPVVAVFEVGMSEYDSTFVFMPLESAQKYFRLGAAVSGLEIMVSDPDQVPRLRDTVTQAAASNVHVVDWQEVNSSFFSALQVERNVMFMILTLIILVAALNMISGLVMLVKDKGHDIAILRTMGATSGSMMRIFFICGASVGVLGSLAGVLTGTLFCNNIEAIRQWVSSLTGTALFSPEIYFLSQMPARMDPKEVASVIIMALSLSMLATLYPAFRAARLDPVEALRYE